MSTTRAESIKGFTTGDCGDSSEFLRSRDVTDARLQQLLASFRGLPKVMFCDSILRMYSSCEVSLDRTRSDLFDRVRTFDGFPAGSTMKRRVPTRSGSLVSEKLAGDIHTLLSVIEGMEFSSPEVKELLSYSHRKKSRSAIMPSIDSLRDTPGRTGPSGSQGDEIASLGEWKSLSDSVVSLKAEVLGMSQQYAANETARSKQIRELKESVLRLKSDLSSLAYSARQSVRDMKLPLERIESETGLSITRLKNDVKQMRRSIVSLEESVDMFSAAMDPNGGARAVRKSPACGRDSNKKAASSTKAVQTSHLVIPAVRDGGSVTAAADGAQGVAGSREGRGDSSGRGRPDESVESYARVVAGATGHRAGVSPGRHLSGQPTPTGSSVGRRDGVSPSDCRQEQARGWSGVTGDPRVDGHHPSGRPTTV